MRAFAGVVFFLFITNIFPQTINLRDTTNQFDYIIITVPEFVSACQPLKDHKEQNRNLKTIIVDTTAIFTEFNTDTTKQDDIRRFISYAGTYWQDPKPQFVFIVGNTSKVPGFQLYNVNGESFPLSKSDFLYSENLYEPDTLNADIAIGRLPAKTVTQIENYNNKVLLYEDSANTTDYDKILLVSQVDSLFGYTNFHYGLISQFPSFYNIKLFTTHSDSANYGNTDSILSIINNGGVSSLWATGHNEDSSFFSDSTFSINDVEYLNNNNEFFISFLFGRQYYSTDSTTSITSELILSENGSIAGFGHVGVAFWSITKLHFKLILDSVYYSHKSLGHILLDFPFGSNYPYYHHKLSLSLFGDPSLKLHPQNLTGVDDNSTAFVPKEFSLEQNYPNPFNPSTRIQYEIPVTLRQAQHDNPHVQLIVFDVLGNEVAVLVDKFKPAGSYEVDFNAKGLSSGIYFYQLKAGNFVETKKMVLLR